MTQTAALASDLLTREEAARLLRVSTVTLDLWTKAQTGPASTRLGGRVFFRNAEIARFLDERTKQGSQTMESSPETSLAQIVESELTPICDIDGPMRQAMLAATSGLAQAIRAFDLKIRSRGCSIVSARRFISAIESLIRNLCEIADTRDLDGTLAEDIAKGALQTAYDIFPELLPDDLRPAQ